MENILFQDTYPILYQEFSKAQCRFESMDELIAYFKQRIDEDPMGVLISVFDQRTHTLNVGGDLGPELQGAINIVFCFGHKLPNARVLAVKPRSIGIADLGDSYGISFMRAPNAPAQEKMLEWVTAISAE